MTVGASRPPRLGWLLLACPLFLLFRDLSAFGLFNNVEGMCAEIAREMLAGGHWIIPSLNDVPYIEKPPLVYWLAALSMSLFGTNDWAVRLVPAAAGLLLLATVGWFAWRVKGARYALLAVFILGTSTGFLIMWRDTRPDALLATFIYAAWLTTYQGLVSRQRILMIAAAICLALAVLSKGFVALALYGPVVAAYLVWSRRREWRDALRAFLDPWAVAAFLAVLLPWHIAAIRALPEFTWFYFVNEHIYRFLGMRQPPDYFTGSVFYYLPRLALMFLPWLPLLALPRFVARDIRTADADPSRFLWCCVLTPLIFFSLSRAKANYYAVVCVPALALLAALALEHWLEQKRHSARLWVGLFVIAIALFPAGEALLRYGQRIESRFSARPMAVEIQRRAAAGEGFPVFLYQDYEDYSSLPFYLQSTIDIVDERSQDLKFGKTLGYGRTHFLSVEEFMMRREPAWLVVLDPRQRDLVLTPLPGRLQAVAKIGRATLYRWPGAAGNSSLTSGPAGGMR